MKAIEVKISRFYSSYAMATLLVAMALVMMWISWHFGDFYPEGFEHGLALDSPNQWFGDRSVSCLFSILACALTGAMMVVQNRTFNILRSYSVTFIGLFILMSAALPSVALAFNGGSLLAPVMMLCLMTLMASYRRTEMTRRVFLVFCLLSAGAMVQYGFIMFLPVMLMGMAQMQIMTLRSLVASLLGIATPWIILLTFGYDTQPLFRTPEFVSIFEEMPEPKAVHFLITVGITLLISLGIGLANIFKILTFNAKARAMNGLLSVTTVMTMAMTIIDITNIYFYVTLLNACTAYQVGHFFAMNVRRRGYLLPLTLTLGYTALWVWGLIG